MIDVAYLERMLRQFEIDPADSDFQRGYQACLEELLRVAKEYMNA